MQHSIQFPIARKENLIVKEMDDETLVYDRKTDQAHCLNSTAARVWGLCDGQTSVAEIAQSVANQKETEADETVVWLALDQLKKLNLLEEAPPVPAHLAGMNRRQMVRNMGLAALTLPLIISIAAPTPAQTASQCACTTSNCRPIGCACTNPSQCANHPGSQCQAGICI